MAPQQGHRGKDARLKGQAPVSAAAFRLILLTAQRPGEVFRMRSWTPQDLRRTAASKMRSLGVDRRVVQAILNHTDWSITAVYDRYGMDPEKQEALDLWGRRVEEIVGGGAPGAVVPFPVGPSGSGMRERRAHP